MERFLILVAIFLCFSISTTVRCDEEFSRILGRCPKNAPDFDDCMKVAFNDLKAYFSTGIPEYNIAPFDPHHSDYVEQRRGDRSGLGGFKLILRNVSEYGWSRSEVTKYRTDRENNGIVYSQHFPEKSLEGFYEFSGMMLGKNLKREGPWNMTLYDYSQTTSVHRIGEAGGLLKVHVEVDRIGGMEMHIGNILNEGRTVLNSLADNVINTSWKLGFPFIKPLINDLVSTAFTDIFNESFRNFPIDNFIRDS
ncbi:uncharacterized protein LOC129942662 [Eupeodes corollae]|uniref:uncharacterized protein LOC129942662 n=1 Tax=Eupeodes corollae TaxID=290404 RepID=UPI002490EDF0|nr:uncharacterized protein LOC129942662 [Eupeodes corollae]